MCYLFSWFGWALDLVQRAITFCLACVLTCIVCIGALAAVGAGVAYGYNYSMAEFLAFTGQDVTVYMRRGQWYDKPEIEVDKELASVARRAGGGPPDAFSPTSAEVAGGGINVKPVLPKSWVLAQDSRKYIEQLTRYRSTEPGQTEPFDERRLPPAVREEIARRDQLANAMSTSMDEMGNTKVIMRHFQTMNKDRFVSRSSTPGMVRVLPDTLTRQVTVKEIFMHNLTPVEGHVEPPRTMVQIIPDRDAVLPPDSQTPKFILRNFKPIRDNFIPRQTMMRLEPDVDPNVNMPMRTPPKKREFMNYGSVDDASNDNGYQDTNMKNKGSVQHLVSNEPRDSIMQTDIYESRESIRPTTQDQPKASEKVQSSSTDTTKHPFMKIRHWDPRTESDDVEDFDEESHSFGFKPV